MKKIIQITLLLSSEVVSSRLVREMTYNPVKPAAGK